MLVLETTSEALELAKELVGPTSVQMYQPKKDRVVEIDAAPRPDVGAPLPALVSDEGNVLLAYRH